MCLLNQDLLQFYKIKFILKISLKQDIFYNFNINYIVKKIEFILKMSI